MATVFAGVYTSDKAASTSSRVTKIGGVIISLLPGVDVTGVDVTTIAQAYRSAHAQSR